MLDREEFVQVRALAEVEGTCPDEAVRAFLRQEHRYYDIITTGGGKVTRVPLPIPGGIRTEESKRRRAEANRTWWREHGAAYRAKRRAEGRPLLGGKAYRATTR